MSSLSATQADGYYVPPEYYESGQYKKKSKNQFARSKGHNQFLQNGVVRFELPHDGFCKGCGAHVGKGTRFNAQKTKGGNYFTTTIWKFSMKCRVCSKTEFVIETDPKNRDFTYVQGIHRQVQEFDTTEAGTAGVVDTEYGNKLVAAGGESGGDTSALAHLESVACGKRKAMTEHDKLSSLIKLNASTYQDDAASNAALRSTFRVDRRRKKQRVKAGKTLGWKDGMELKDESLEDVATARETCFGNGKATEKKRFRKLYTSGIFGKKKQGGRQRKSDPRPDDVPSTRPDPVSSSFSTEQSCTHVSSSNDQTNKERKRIRLIPTGTKLVRDTETHSASAEESAKPVAATTSSLAALADYDSDSD